MRRRELKSCSVSFTGRSKRANRCVALITLQPPYMLSKEVSTVYVTDPDDANKTKRATGEINWSLGTYIPVRRSKRRFRLAGLPRPSNVAPNQPYKHKWVYKYWLIVYCASRCWLGFVTLVIVPVRPKKCFRKLLRCRRCRMPTERRCSSASHSSWRAAQHQDHRRVAGAEYVGLSRRRSDQRRNGRGPIVSDRDLLLPGS